MATVSPFRLQITGAAATFTLPLLNGPESTPLRVSVFTGNHLLITFTLLANPDATLADVISANGAPSGTMPQRYHTPLSLVWVVGTQTPWIAAQSINGALGDAVNLLRESLRGSFRVEAPRMRP